MLMPKLRPFRCASTHRQIRSAIMHQNAVQLACDDQYEMLAADFGVNAPLILCLQPLSLHYALLCTMQSVEHKRCADPHNPRRRTGCPASSRFNATTKKNSALPPFSSSRDHPASALSRTVRVPLVAPAPETCLPPPRRAALRRRRSCSQSSRMGCRCAPPLLMMRHH